MAGRLHTSEGAGTRRCSSARSESSTATGLAVWLGRAGFFGGGSTVLHSHICGIQAVLDGSCVSWKAWAEFGHLASFQAQNVICLRST